MPDTAANNVVDVDEKPYAETSPSAAAAWRPRVRRSEKQAASNMRKAMESSKVSSDGPPA